MVEATALSASTHPILHEIFINKQLYRVSTHVLTGTELKRLAGIPADNQLFLEAHPKDLPIGDGERVELKNGMHFYDVAPGNFG